MFEKCYLSLNQRLQNLMSRKTWDYVKMIFAEIIYEWNYHKKEELIFARIFLRMHQIPSIQFVMVSYVC